MRASSSNSRGPGGPEGPGGGVGATTPSIHGSIPCFSPIQPEATLSASTRRFGNGRGGGGGGRRAPVLRKAAGMLRRRPTKWREAYSQRLRTRRTVWSAYGPSARAEPVQRWSNQPTAAPTAANIHHTAMKANQSTRTVRPATLVQPGSVHLITVANIGAKSISATVAMAAPRRAAHQPLRGRDGAISGCPSSAPATAAASPGNPRNSRKETGFRLRARTGPNHAPDTSTPASPKATAGLNRAALARSPERQETANQRQRCAQDRPVNDPDRTSDTPALRVPPQAHPLSPRDVRALSDRVVQTGLLLRGGVCQDHPHEGDRDDKHHDQCLKDSHHRLRSLRARPSSPAARVGVRPAT